MRFLLVIGGKYPIPSDVAPSLVEGFVSWWERYRERWISAGFFPGGSGGGGICDVADEVELHTMMQEWPLNSYSQIDVYPLVDMDVALGQWQRSATAGT